MVLCHAFYKGTLFLGAGSVIHGNAENQDMRIMGRFRWFLPVTAFACVFAWLAIAGIPPFSGFWSKDDILVNAFDTHNYGVWAIGTIAAVFTALYMTRLIFMTFFGNARFGETADAVAVPVVSGGSDEGVHGEGDSPSDGGVHEEDFEPTVQFGEPPRPSRLHGHDPHESPIIMLIPLAVLSILAVIGGVLNLPIGDLDFLTRFLEPVFRGVHEVDPSTVEQVSVEGVSALFALTGLTIGYFLYRRGLRTPAEDPLPEKLGAVGKVLGHAYYYDESISRFVGGPGRGMASWLDRVFDQKVIDGTVNGIAKLFGLFGKGLGKIEDGLVRRYALGILLGTVAVVLFLLLWAGR
jgi:NADH-quinone oxidoreductase subunit L